MTLILHHQQHGFAQITADSFHLAKRLAHKDKATYKLPTGYRCIRVAPTKDKEVHTQIELHTLKQIAHPYL